MKAIGRLVVAAVMLGSGCACARDVSLSAVLSGGNRVQVSLWSPGHLAVQQIELYRSTTQLKGTGMNTVGYPITVLRFQADTTRTELVDSMVAHNVTYYYRARMVLETDEELWSSIDSVAVPDVELGRITGSSILIDKKHYFLEIRDGGQMKKRYPVALGRKPANRKLHQDNASTPEGIYQITGEQPQATFYKALDIDYPNEIDRARYNFAKAEGLIELRGDDVPGIGGQIQIHGQGIETNWTYGCIALRNSDMDELFEHERVGVGVPVVIIGREITREDISSIQDYRTPREIKAIQRDLKELGFYSGEPDGIVGTRTRHALARFQQAHALPATCDFDTGTVRLLSQTE